MPHGLVGCGVRKQMKTIQVAVLAVVILLVPLLRGQTDDEEKKRLFLQSREDIRPVPKPSPSATEHPKPRPKPHATPREHANDEEPTPKPHPKPAHHATPKEEETPRPKPHATPREHANDEDKPKPKKSPEEKPASKNGSKPSEPPDFIPLPGEVTKPAPEAKPTPATKPPVEEKPKPTPTPTHAPSPTPTATPAQIPSGKTPSGQPIDAPILIQKSGLEEHQGYEPPSIPLFSGFFKRWRYLTPGVRKAIDQALVKRGRWQYIVVHNSGTRQGNARIFDVYHRNVRKMQNGLAYHFVIGNGNSSGDGEIEIGNRWTRQINGGHVASDHLNDIALGICLVGDLNRDKPTSPQLGALDELITYLRIRVGKIKGKPSIVKGHKEINPKPTDCPGDRFPLGWLHQKFPG